MDGGTFSGLLTLVFIVLKLTGFIAWSWWWVLSPLWISFGLALLIIGIAVTIYLVTGRSAKGRLKAYGRAVTGRK